MDIFNFIEHFSYKIAGRIGKNDSEDDIELYRYSIFMISSYIFTTGFGLILSILFGYWTPYIISHITFISLRKCAGGYHCDAFYKCFITTNMTFMLSSILAVFLQDFYNIMWLVSLFYGIFILPYCPYPSANSPSRGKTEDMRFRKRYRNILMILAIISLVFIHFELFLFSTSISMGIIALCFMASKPSEIILNKIWN